MKLGNFREPSNSEITKATGDIIFYNPAINGWDVLPIGTEGQICKVGVGDAFTVLQSSFNGADEATAYTDPIAGAYTFQGTAKLDNAVADPFGGSTTSLLLDGDSDYVTLPDSASWDFGAENFTIDTWVRFAVTPASDQHIVTQYVDGNNRTGLQYSTAVGGILNCFCIAGNITVVQFYCTWNPVADTWYHIAAVRNGATALLFINGIPKSVTTTALGTWGNIASVLQIGKQGAIAPEYYNGYIKELRISKGIARWTTDFVPLTVAYGLQPKWVT